MNRLDYQRILKRLDDVIQINVMTANQADFLATHMPFEHLEVTSSGLSNAQARSMSEEQAYEDLIRDAGQEHRFIIVKGNNGTGKSHLIRWLQARMLNDQQNGELGNEKIVFIRRIDNTLRGAISQLLEQNVVSDPDQLKRMRNFVDAVSNMSETQLKDTILNFFISQMRSDTEEGKIAEFKKPEAQDFVEFLNCEPVRNKLLEAGGPISRFYELISKPSQNGINASAPRFDASDFSFDRDKAFQNEMMQYRSVRKIASGFFNLSRNHNAQKLANVLNSYSESVIQRTAHIGGEDTTQIMINLRKELKKQGKNLTIFIEDMTTFTGIDTELIKILVEGNTGTYSDFCRVTSVIGITDAYYNERFKGNFQDRVTHQVVVDNRSFGAPDTLYKMAARYLNAVYLTPEEVLNWLEEGAKPAKIPFRAVGPDYPWDSVKINDEDYSLFPFTKQALVKLFDRLEDVNKTPRNFLRAEIREQMVTYLYNQLEGVPFPSTTKDAIGSSPVSFARHGYDQSFELLTAEAADEEEKKSFRALICFWGNATVTGDDHSLAGLPKEFIESLKYSFLSEIKPGGLEPAEVEPIAPEQPGVTGGTGTEEKKQVVFPATLVKQLNDIDQWVQGSGYVLQSSNFLRKCVSDFLYEALNWPMEGVPTYLVELFLHDNRKVYIENQKEKVPTAETALIILPKSVEVSFVLKGLAIRETLKDWNFDESAFYQQRIAIWLEKNKQEFVRRLLDQDKVESMKELLMASLTAEYLYLGIMGGFSRDEAHLREKLFKKKNDLLAVERGKDNKRFDEWGKLIDAMSLKAEENRFKDNKEVLTRMIKSTTGDAQTTSDNVLVWGQMVDEAFNAMRKAHWDFAPKIKGKVFNKDNRLESTYLLLQDYIPRVAAVLEDEKQNFREICEKLPEYVENPEDAECWRSVAKETSGFLKNMNSMYGVAYPGDFDSAVQKVKNTAETLAAIVRNGKAVCEMNQPSALLVFFSSDPIQMNLMAAINTFNRVREFAEAQKLKYETAMNSGDFNSTLNAEIEATKDQIAALMENLSQEVE